MWHTKHSNLLRSANVFLNHQKKKNHFTFEKLREYKSCSKPCTLLQREIRAHAPIVVTTEPSALAGQETTLEGLPFPHGVSKSSTVEPNSFQRIWSRCFNFGCERDVSYERCTCLSRRSRITRRGGGRRRIRRRRIPWRHDLIRPLYSCQT
jgi:hypothetical protein